MFGRNGAKSGPARGTRVEAGETDSLVISQGGFFNGNVSRVRERDAHPGPRSAHLVEAMRRSAQK